MLSYMQKATNAFIVACTCDCGASKESCYQNVIKCQMHRKDQKGSEKKACLTLLDRFDLPCSADPAFESLQILQAEVWTNAYVPHMGYVIFLVPKCSIDFAWPNMEVP